MNEKLEFFTSIGYGEFPYIIIREMTGVFRQVPISFSLPELIKKEGVLVNPPENEGDEILEKKCVSVLRNIIKSEPVITIKRNLKDNWVFSGHKKIEGCVVFSNKRAIYLDSEGKIKRESDCIPYGGSLLSMCGEIIIQGGQHYKLK